MKTFVPKKDDIEKKWWVIDAEGKIARIWPKVDPAKHADWVLAEL